MSEKCKETVYPKEQWGAFHGHRCKKPVWKDGYCKIHHPESKAKRDEESRIRWEQKWDNSPLKQLSRALERIKDLEGLLDTSQKITARECAEIAKSHISYDDTLHNVAGIPNTGARIAAAIRAKYGVE